jgi:hypothetical protein
MNKTEVQSAPRRNNQFTLARLLLGVMSLSLAAESGQIKLRQISRVDLCVTEGTVERLPGQSLSVNVPKMRAYVNTSISQAVEADFTYLGSTGNESRLGSGEMRRQFGLKLRAQDACNLVYVMWRIEPESKLVVSVKINPGQHTSAQCGNRGYRNLKPRRGAPVPVLHPGEAHSLRAEMNGAEMKVFADRKLVWDGNVGSDTLHFDGPAGLRSDNARLQIALRASQPVERQNAHEPGCRSGSDESE